MGSKGLNFSFLRERVLYKETLSMRETSDGLDIIQITDLGTAMLLMRKVFTHNTRKEKAMRCWKLDRCRQVEQLISFAILLLILPLCLVEFVKF